MQSHTRTHTFQHAQEPVASTSTPAAAAVSMDQDDENFDVTQDKFKGQFALRRLYHESDRLIAVLYTSPACGPCRCV